MPARWTKQEEKKFHKELLELYVRKNKSIREVGAKLGIAEQTVYARLVRTGIKTQRSKKSGFNKQRSDIHLPHNSVELAEFIGIMLGDGHISHFQTVVTLGSKEERYVVYVASLMRKLFGVSPKLLLRKDGYREVYIGSVLITTWLKKQGLVSHKVKSQVRVPRWIFKREKYMASCLRGFFDTDGSIYKLRFGFQISLTNKSLLLLLDLRNMLKMLGYKPSEVSTFRVYLTHREDISRFFKEIAPANSKHRDRFKMFASVAEQQTH